MYKRIPNNEHKEITQFHRSIEGIKRQDEDGNEKRIESVKLGKASCVI
jgi:hypothetical protein